MTREEAIAIIRKEYLCVDRDCDIERSCGRCDLMMPSKEPILEAYNMAIEALEQETSNDLIDRQAVLDIDFHKLILTTAKPAEIIRQKIEQLPSINQQKPKTGRLYNDIYDHYLCGNCKTIVMDYDNFCPNCGAKLQESEE